MTNHAFAAWDGTDPVRTSIELEIIYLQHFPPYDIDVDNMSKPIQDALQDLVYADDEPSCVIWPVLPHYIPSCRGPGSYIRYWGAAS